LIEEGTKVWNSISQNNRLIHWENVIFEIEEQFMRITCSSTRSLTEKVAFSSPSSCTHCEHTRTPCCYLHVEDDMLVAWK
jgi:hypothetical protein